MGIMHTTDRTSLWVHQAKTDLSLCLDLSSTLHPHNLPRFKGERDREALDFFIFTILFADITSYSLYHISMSFMVTLKELTFEYLLNTWYSAKHPFSHQEQHYDCHYSDEEIWAQKGEGTCLGVTQQGTWGKCRIWQSGSECAPFSHSLAH